MSKQPKAKSKGTDARVAAEASRTRTAERAKVRNAANLARHALNVGRHREGEMTPWQRVRAERTARRAIDPEVVARRKARTRGNGGTD